MTATDDRQDLGEVRPSYQTLNDPTRLLGLSLSGWAALIVAGGLAYGFLAVSPLSWRLNFSIAVIGLGAPALLLILREPGTIGPGRLLAAVFGWRLRPALLLPPDDEPVKSGAIRLDQRLELVPDDELAPDVPWAER